MKVTYCVDYITGNVFTECYQTRLKVFPKNLLSFFISLPNDAKENSKCSIMILIGVSHTPRIFTTFLELNRHNNKASLINMSHILR